MKTHCDSTGCTIVPERKKKVHGEKVPLWKQYGLCEFPPVACDLKVEDRVEYRNDYGVVFNDMIVMGFSKSDSFYGRFIHLTRINGTPEGNAWWYAHHPDSIRKYKSIIEQAEKEN